MLIGMNDIHNHKQSYILVFKVTILNNKIQELIYIDIYLKKNN